MSWLDLELAMGEADLELLILLSLCSPCAEITGICLVYMVLRLNLGFHTGEATILPSELRARPHLEGFTCLLALGHFSTHIHVYNDSGHVHHPYPFSAPSLSH